MTVESVQQGDRRITFGSLFSGIGGMDLGLERAGMECRWQVEWDVYCQSVLDRHWPAVKRYGDITDITGPELESVDLIAGGFPCQDVSICGLRKGIGSGTRSGLYADMLRIVSHLRPRFVLMENVSGLLIPERSGEPAPISRVLGDLSELGYDAEWQTRRACEFGAPHPRSRVFILAYTNRNGLEENPANAILREQARNGGNAGHDSANGCTSILCRESIAGTLAREPEIMGVTERIPDRVHRIKALGNAVVPQVAEYIGRQILAHMKT